jgi:flagellar basal-body rod modification protein FlgD
MTTSALISQLGLDTGRAYRRDTSGPNAFSSDAFMQLLLAQLRNQNPLDPVQDKEFMGQLTQLNSLQELQKMTTMFQTFARTNNLSQAAALIGKTVEARLPDGKTETGVVSGVTLNGADAVVHIGSKTVPYASITSIRAL